MPLTAAVGRRFAFTVGGAFLVLGGFLAWRDVVRPGGILASVGALLVLAGLIAPTKLGAVERAWMALGRALSRISTPIVLALVYFLVLTPIGLVRRRRGSPVRRARTQTSYWIERTPADAAARRRALERQF